MPSQGLEVTDLNKSPLIGLVVWLCLAMALLATVTRIASKLILTKIMKIDDGLLIISAAAATAQSVMVLNQVSRGFGTPITTRSPDDIDFILKYGYVANILFIVSLLFSKLSIALTTASLVQAKFWVFLLATQIFIGMWAGASFFTSIFECDMPKPWEYRHGQCINRVNFWTYVSAGNIATDVAMVCILVNSIVRLQMNWSKKSLVLGVFGCRIIVIPAVVFQIIYTHKYLDSPDPIFDLWPMILTIQVVQSLSIITTCVPTLKPFVDSLESGQLRADDMRRQGKVSIRGYTSEHGIPESQYSVTGSKYLSSQTSPRVPTFELSQVQMPMSRRTGSVAISSVTAEVTQEKEKPIAWDRQSHTSQTVLIQTTKTWEVDVEHIGVAHS